MTYRVSPPFTCVSCDGVITSQPVFHVGLPFCCPGCAAGGPCSCSYDPADPAPAGLAALHAAVEALPDDAFDDVPAEPAIPSGPVLTRAPEPTVPAAPVLAGVSR